MAFIQGTAIAINARGLLLMGPPASGKSDLALRLVDRGATLIADDLVHYAIMDGWPHLLPPTGRSGALMTRDIGLVRLATTSTPTPLAMVLHLLPDAAQNQPQPDRFRLSEGVEVPAVSIYAKTASAAIIAELAFHRWAL